MVQAGYILLNYLATDYILFPNNQHNLHRMIKYLILREGIFFGYYFLLLACWLPPVSNHMSLDFSYSMAMRALRHNSANIWHAARVAML